MTLRTVLVIQHVALEGPGLLEPAFDRAGLERRTVRTWKREVVPASASGHAAVVIMGGPMGVYEADRHPHLKDEIALAADALRAGVPILGVCLGAQILAAAAGARVFIGPGKEIGWRPIDLTPAGRADRLLGALPARPTVFHWHGDTFDLPPGATLLASSDLYPHQAFRVGPCAWGVQFHIEVSAGMIDRWVEAFSPGDIGAAGGGAAVARLRSEAAGHAAALAPHIDRMVVALVR
jgi:GMP synthase (glutamine-hydrolysing)